MIRTVAELMQGLLERERAVLAAQKLTHAPSIGQMYEGLTRNMLEQSIPGRGIRVAQGFITNSGGQRSSQIDCMVIVGEGKPIPYTDMVECDIRDVVAVIEVKKKLYSKDLADGFANLRSVTTTCEPKDLTSTLIDHAIRRVLQVKITDDDQIGKLPQSRQMVYHSLVVEAALPLRIILGYHGFASERRLRKAFLKFLTSKLGIHGYGPLNFPNLVICYPYSLIKLNGIPFGTAMREDAWDILASSSRAATYFLLNLIWARLANLERLNIKDFGFESAGELCNLFLSTRYNEGEQKKGWQFHWWDLTEAQLAEGMNSQVQWEPVFLNLEQYTVINNLCVGDSIDITEKSFCEWLRKAGHEPETFVAELCDTGLTYTRENKLQLLTDSCAAVILPDGRFAAGENNWGQLVRWVSEHYPRK